MTAPEGETPPTVLVFDVNETLIDLAHLTPLFARLFGRTGVDCSGVMRDWFAQMILYSQTITLAGAYVPLSTLGAGALRMIGRLRGVSIADDDIAELGERTGSLPAHADVAPALDKLKAAGFRLATLTNSAPRPDGGPLRRSGLEPYFEQRLSVDAVKRFKTAPETYRAAAEALGVAPGAMCLVACHAWDCLGAQLFGATGALVLRAGNAVFEADGLPPPTLVAPDMGAMAEMMIARWR